jgi:uncharacterized membrane protein
VLAEQLPAPFEWIARPNRSLTSKGRQLWLWLVASSALVTAGAALLIGAWPVLPFAGMEVILVWIAFRVIASHDGDYEVLRVNGLAFEWERRAGGEVRRLDGNAAWASVQVFRSRHSCSVQLRYAGKCVTLGDFATNSRREQLLAQLAPFFPTASIRF